MSKFNIFITAHRSLYVCHYKELSRRLEAEFPEARLHILLAVERTQETADLPADFHFLHPQGFGQTLNRSIDAEAVCARLMRFAHVVPPDLHRSEIRGLVGIRNHEMLALEQALLCEEIETIFERHPPHLVFVSSGTNVLHSIAYHIATARGAKTYRVHNYLNLNLNLEGQRVWFCASNKMALSDAPEDKFDYEAEAVRQHITFLHKAVIERLYKLDQISKKFRQRRMPITLRQLARDVARILYYRSPLQKKGEIGKLSANASIDRLRVMVNAQRNRAITLAPTDLPKRYILFALNTPYDSQILVRAPEYRDFPSLIELVAGMVPYGYDLVLREHPAFLGMLDHDRMKALQARHPHVKIGSSESSFPDILKGARGVLIINNTALVDTILGGKPVISLANGYFKGKYLTREVGQLQDLRAAFQELICGKLDVDLRSRLEEVMGELFHETYPGPEQAYSDKLAMINDGVIDKLRRIADLYGSLDAFRAHRKGEISGESQ